MAKWTFSFCCTPCVLIIMKIQVLLLIIPTKLCYLQRNAASTYNILNEEGRIVAAALLPYGVSS